MATTKKQTSRKSLRPNPYGVAVGQVLAQLRSTDDRQCQGDLGCRRLCRHQLQLAYGNKMERKSPP